MPETRLACSSEDITSGTIAAIRTTTWWSPIICHDFWVYAEATLHILIFLRVVLTCDNPPNIGYCFWFTILAKGLAIVIMMSITLQTRDLLGKLYCSYKYPTQLYLQWLGLWQQDESLELMDLLWCGHGLRLYSYPASACPFFFKQMSHDDILLPLVLSLRSGT